MRGSRFGALDYSRIIGSSCLGLLRMRNSKGPTRKANDMNITDSKAVPRETDYQFHIQLGQKELDLLKRELLGPRSDGIPNAIRTFVDHIVGEYEALLSDGQKVPMPRMPDRMRF